MRDLCRAGLNKGEADNRLARYFHESGKIRDESFASQAFRACGVNLVVGAIIMWNTAHLSLVFESSHAEIRDLPNDIVRHISPQIWEHSNLTGIYDWNAPSQLVDAFRPLRLSHLKNAEAT